LDLKDVLWRGTPADWAHHQGRTEIEAYLRAQEGDNKEECQPSQLFAPSRVRN